LEGESCGGVVEEGGVHEAVFSRVRVPEEHAAFAVLSTFHGFRLEDVGGLPVEVVGDCHRGGLIERHEAGEFGEDGGDEGVLPAGTEEGGGADGDHGGVLGMVAGD